MALCAFGLFLVLCAGRSAASNPPAHAQVTAACDLASQTILAHPLSPKASVLKVGKHPHGDPAGRPRLGKGIFLVANRKLVDPNFRRSVVLLVAHGDDGAMGVVVNRPTPLTLSAVLPDIAELAERSDPLYLGGPVATSQITLLLRAAKPPENAQHVFRDVYFSGSLTTLMQHVRDEQIADTMQAYAGYAGWAAGQLEGEVERGDWSLVEADAELLFSSSPEDMWRELNRQSSGLWVKAAECNPGMAWLTGTRKEQPFCP